MSWRWSRCQLGLHAQTTDDESATQTAPDEESAPAPEETPAEKATRLLNEPETEAEKFPELRAEIAAATGEARELLTRQYQDDQILFGTELHDTAALIRGGHRNPVRAAYRALSIRGGPAAAELNCTHPVPCLVEIGVGEQPDVTS